MENKRKKINYIYFIIAVVVLGITVFAMVTALGNTAGKHGFSLDDGWEKDRGNVYDRDSNPLVYSESVSDGNDDTKLVRKYDKVGAAYSNIIGFRTVFEAPVIDSEGNTVTNSDGTVRKTNIKRTEGVIEHNMAEWLVVGNKPGADIGGSYILTTDSGLQKKCYDELVKFNKANKTTMAAACVIDIQSGEILAMTDTPGYDTQKVVDSATEEEFNKNIPANSLYPFCTSSQIPGSTFKIATAAALCKLGYIDKEFDDSIPFKYNGTNGEVKNSDGAVHGLIGLADAIRYSSNVYFAMAAKAVDEDEKSGREKLLEQYEELWKFNSEIKLDFCTLRPTLNLDNYQNLYNTPYGQGSCQISPLNICMITAAIADGNFFKPYLIKDYLDCEGKLVASKSGKKEIITKNVVSEEAQKCIRKGMEGVASRYGVNNAAVKTGTATLDGDKVNIWITGFYPKDNPRFALTVSVFEASEDHYGSNLKDIANHIFGYLNDRNL